MGSTRLFQLRKLKGFPHNLGDNFTPEARSEAFARALPGRVTLERISGGNHVEAWNADPARYATRVNAWFSAHVIGRDPG